MHWKELEERQPRLAAKARERLVEPGVLLVVSLRRDGTPRLSPVEPLVMDGRLLLSMLWGSHKARDLQRDPRVLVHGIVTGPDGGTGELKVRGHAVVVSDPDTEARYAAAVAADLGWSPEVGRFHLFDVDLEHVAFVRYDHESGDQYVTTWPPGKEYVRRGTTATSVGEPQPFRELLV
jgi:hypothetical protein